VRAHRAVQTVIIKTGRQKLTPTRTIGVSAGLDMALELIAELAGDQAAQEAQLLNDYDP
jgi:transcriptional regulator GlxA family with amidase domain